MKYGSKVFATSYFHTYRTVEDPLKYNLDVQMARSVDSCCSAIEWSNRSSSTRSHRGVVRWRCYSAFVISRSTSVPKIAVIFAVLIDLSRRFILRLWTTWRYFSSALCCETWFCYAKWSKPLTSFLMEG